MQNDKKNQNALSIWTWRNIAHITKMDIECTIAIASLAAAMATMFISAGAIAGPTFLSSISNPVGITALFIAAVYFTAAAYSSYQQIHKNEEVKEISGIRSTETKLDKTIDSADKSMGEVENLLRDPESLFGGPEVSKVVREDTIKEI